jgi:hypothetical protein
MSLHEQAAGYSDFLLFSKGPVSYTFTQGFLNVILILSASPTIRASEISDIYFDKTEIHF